MLVVSPTGLPPADRKERAQDVANDLLAPELRNAKLRNVLAVITAEARIAKVGTKLHGV
jgi:hypothetical protein